MVDELNGIGGSGSVLGGSTAIANKNSSEVVDKDEFLQLLVTQLKNQDPLNPMDNQRFAVDLATFSQLEQLISINDKLNQEPTPDSSSLAAYLGYDVTLNTNVVRVAGGEGGKVSFQLPEDATSVTIDLLDSSGAVVESKEVGPLSAGKQMIALSELTSANGEYAVQVRATGQGGTQMTPQAYAAGTVTGFVPGPEPLLIVNGMDVDPAAILEVNLSA